MLIAVIAHFHGGQGRLKSMEPAREKLLRALSAIVLSKDFPPSSGFMTIPIINLVVNKWETQELMIIGGRLGEFGRATRQGDVNENSVREEFARAVHENINTFVRNQSHGQAGHAGAQAGQVSGGQVGQASGGQAGAVQSRNYKYGPLITHDASTDYSIVTQIGPGILGIELIIF
jgi:hypothetical protein